MNSQKRLNRQDPQIVSNCTIIWLHHIVTLYNEEHIKTSGMVLRLEARNNAQ